MAEQNGTHDEWVMPEVSVGQIVLWMHAGGSVASPAIVHTVGQCTVNLHIHAGGIKDHILRTGCRHQDDPFLKRTPQHEGGVWRLTPRDEKINMLLEVYRRQTTIDGKTGLLLAKSEKS